MSTLPTPSQLADLDDPELERLAVSWRARASHGEREAFGIAHALEVERRERLRASQVQQRPPGRVVKPRPWWKFSGAGGEAGRSPRSSS